MARALKYDKAMHWMVLPLLERPRTVEELAELSGMTERDVRIGLDTLRRLATTSATKTKTLSSG